MNKHVGSDIIDYDKVHGRYGCKEINEAGKRILDLVSSNELAMVNTFFRKRKCC